MKYYCKHCRFSKPIAYTGFICFPPIELDEQIEVCDDADRLRNHRDFILAANSTGECKYYFPKYGLFGFRVIKFMLLEDSQDE